MTNEDKAKKASEACKAHLERIQSSKREVKAFDEKAARENKASLQASKAEKHASGLEERIKAGRETTEKAKARVK